MRTEIAQAPPAKGISKGKAGQTCQHGFAVCDYKCVMGDRTFSSGIVVQPTHLDFAGAGIYSVLNQKGHWDRMVEKAAIGGVEGIRFRNAAESYELDGCKRRERIDHCPFVHIPQDWVFSSL